MPGTWGARVVQTPGQPTHVSRSNIQPEKPSSGGKILRLLRSDADLQGQLDRLSESIGDDDDLQQV